MRNEYGELLDRNGYAPSILQHEGMPHSQPDRCFVCERCMTLQRHEIFHGAYREKSKNYGLWVNICHHCHTQVHFSDGRLDRALKETGQKAAMIQYGWTLDEFRERFGKNYI